MSRSKSLTRNAIAFPLPRRGPPREYPHRGAGLGERTGFASKMPRMRSFGTDAQSPGLPAAALLLALAAALLLATGAVRAQNLADTIARVKPSIVGVGSFDDLRRPPALLTGTGFVVGDGRLIVTNNHVVPLIASDESSRRIVVFTPANVGGVLDGEGDIRNARVVERDIDHDLAILRIEGPPLPALRLDAGAELRDGDPVAFTGFPLGAVLGLHPATHAGHVAAVTPVATPALSPGQITPGALRRLRENFRVYQLDATAYPGNSGSPVYAPGSGRVIAIINSVYVRESKESAIETPSGVTYAIPVRYAAELLAKAQQRGGGQR